MEYLASGMVIELTKQDWVKKIPKPFIILKHPKNKMDSGFQLQNVNLFVTLKYCSQ